MVNEITDAEFEQDVLESGEPVLVDFWAEWCGPCQQLTPIVEEVAEEMKGKVTVLKLNIDENPEIPRKFGVRGIPTLILFKDGQAVATKVGTLAKSALCDWVEEAIAS